MNRLAALGALLVFLGPLRAAAPPTPEGPVEAVRLVRQLGASSFAARESAAQRLLQLGRSAAPSLRNGLKSRDLEVRRRCAALLPAVLRTDEDRRLDAFLRDGSTKGSLPGWVVLKKLAGDDLAARLLYADLYRSDRPLLALLDKALSPHVAAHVAARAQPLAVARALVAACCASSLDEATYSMLINVVARPPGWEHVRDDPALRRLASRALATHGTSSVRLSTTAHLAKSLELQELLDKTVKPAVLRRVTAALTQPPDFDKVAEAVHLACLVGLQSTIAPRARSVARQLAENIIVRPTPRKGRRRRWEGLDVYEVLALLLALDMQDTIDAVLKPALLKQALAVAERPDDQSAFQRVHHLATVFEANEVLKVLKVAGRKVVLTAASQHKAFYPLHHALQLTQELDLPEAREAVLRPAVRKHVLFVLESYEGLGQIGQLVQLTEGAGLSGLIRDTMIPAVRGRAAALVKAPLDVDEINHAHQLARQLGLRDVTEDAVKPALRKLLPVAQRGLLKSEKLSLVFSLVRALRMKEGAALAGQSAARKDLEGHVRARAALLVATLGNREQIAGLEGLLGDRGALGSMGFGDSVCCTTLLSDVALGALVHSSGQSLGDFGFLYFKAWPAAPLETEPVCFGFPDDKARANAIEKWKKWSAGQKNK